MRNIYYIILFIYIPFIFFPYSLSHAEFPEPEVASTVVMAPPEGYVEITQEEYPEYLKAVAEEVYRPEERLRRLFLPETDLPHLRSGEFEKLTRGILLTEREAESLEVFWGGIDGERFFEKLKAKAVAIDSAIDMAQLKTWMGNRDKASRERFLIFVPIAACAQKNMIFLSAISKKTGMSFGIKSGDIALAMFSFSCKGKRFNLAFYRLLDQPEDMKIVAEEAFAYSQDCKRQFSCVPTSPIADYEVPYSLLIYQACSAWRQGNTKKGERIYQQVVQLSTETEGFGPLIHAIAATRVAKCSAEMGNLDKALDILSLAAEQSGEKLEASSAAALYMALGLFQMQAGQVESAVDAFEKAVQQPLEIGEDTTEQDSARMLLFNTYIQLDDYQKAADLRSDVLADVIRYAPERSIASAMLSYMSLTYLHQEKLKSAIFFAKLGLAQVRLEKEQKIPRSKNNEEAFVEFLDTLLSSSGRKEEMPRIEQWRISDTTAALMTGGEISVYARYAETSDALRNAAKSGSEKKIRQARADFLDWMQAMEQALDGLSR